MEKNYMSELPKNSLYDISWKIDESNYRNYNAYSYSILSTFNRKGFDDIKTLFDEVSSKSLTFGSIVDSLITEGQEKIKEKFTIATFPNISESLIKIAKCLFERYNYDSLDSIPDEIISDVAEECEYYIGPKYKSIRVKRVRDNCKEYFNLLKLSIKKQIISEEDYKDAKECVHILKTHEYTKYYFEDNNPFFPSIQRYYQLSFNGKFEMIPLKCRVDLLIVNHSKKQIIPCDLKTSSNREWNFHKSFIKWGYYIQAQLYWYLIRQNLDKDPIYKDYELCDFTFIVINRYNKRPLVWTYKDSKATEDCIYGKSNQIICRNWRNILRDLDYYMRSDCSYPIGINKNNNIIEWLNNE